MITIKSKDEIELIHKAGIILYNTFKYLEPFIKEGTSSLEIDKLAHDYIIKNNAVPSCLGFEGYPNSICISVNDTVVHGIPDDYKFKNGDIVTLDLVVEYKGYNADAAYTYAVGEIDSDKKYLLDHTKEALYEGISIVKPGIRVGDISNKIEEYAKKYNLGIVKELCGHGIGTDMHEDPEIPNYGRKGYGPLLKEGMVICIEPMLTFGKRYVYVLDDEWTVKTEDGSPAAHFEHTVVVTKDGYKILTNGE